TAHFPSARMLTSRTRYCLDANLATPIFRLPEKEENFMRWITFDQETYSALRSMSPRENVFEFPARTALQYALESENAVVAVLPAGPSDAALVTFRKQRAALPDHAVAESGITRGGGILGL